MKTFIQNCLEGARTPGQIDDFVDEWHLGQRRRELRDCIGMTEDEYQEWMNRPRSIDKIVGRHRVAQRTASMRMSQWNYASLAKGSYLIYASLTALVLAGWFIYRMSL